MPGDVGGPQGKRQEREKMQGLSDVLTYPLGTMGRLGNQLFQLTSTVWLGNQHGLRPRFGSRRLAAYFDLDEALFTSPLMLSDATDSRTLVSADVEPEIAEYLQSAEFWGRDRDFARDLLRPKPSLASEAHAVLEGAGVEPGQFCSIHVRRGDYLDYPGKFPVAGSDYVRDALEALQVDNEILIFSDDPHWCSTELAPLLPDARVASAGLPATDLIAMSLAAQLVIANSSFSWWAAYLAGHDRVACPATWFGPEVSVPGDHLQLAGWHRV
ncbi:alpha-1,2-fucosyltransferase [Kribbella sp. NPDC051587]|uniref:alpha-1,2-fucosyltransferase n=1 Tax=Kribbella sp. NPDC051587 TaxID=3364119 RepID=UPI00378FAA5C